MRGIFIESLRGALVRLLRTFIMIVIILLIVFIIGLFHQEKVHALVPKGTVNYSWKNKDFTGNIASNSANKVLIFEFVSNVPKNNNDGLVIRFAKFNFTNNSDFSIDNPYLKGPSTNTYQFQCTNESNLGCTNANIYSTGQSVPSVLNGSINNGSISYYGYAYDSNYQNSSICYFSNDYEDSMICPYNNATNFKYIEFYINQNGFDNVNYNISLNSLQMYFNYDSTEIVQGLQGVTLEQQNTTQAIEDLTTQQEQAQQYIENNNVTSSQTQFQGGVSDLSSQINAQISGVNDLTQIVLLPVTLFMDLATGTCTPLHLVVPFTNNEIDLPCMKPIYEEHFNGLLTIFSTVVCAVTTYWVSVNSAKLIKEILDCDNDRIEVIDL